MTKTKIVLMFATLALVLCGTPSRAQEITPANTIAIEEGDSPETILRKAVHVVPTAAQAEALRNEFIAFIHLGPNTFTRKEWGNGMEDPKIFDLKTLNTDQWCSEMKAAEIKMVILTVKHHEGFVLWQSRYTRHGIMSTDFRDGHGDILRDLSASCRKYGLKLGIYLSPADLYHIERPDGLYGNGSEQRLRTIPREVEGRPFAPHEKMEFVLDDYNEYFMNQLYELLTEYGEIHEVWFDGAHPKRKGNQQYNYLAWRTLIHRLAPRAVIFGREDIRWCGNESGSTRPSEWNIVPYQADPRQMNDFHDITAQDIGSRAKLAEGNFLHYQQTETNTSIREGWFYRDDELQQVRSADDVFDIYERSVGGNSTFLLNIPPNRDGRFSARDVETLREVGRRIRATYHTNLLAGADYPAQLKDSCDDTYILLTPAKKSVEVKLDTLVKINRIQLQESVTTHSERVERFAVDALINGEWQELATSTNIGYKRIVRTPEVVVSGLRFRLLEARADTVALSTFKAHYYKPHAPRLDATQNVEGYVTLSPKKDNFSWKPGKDNATLNLNTGFTIHYTTDGTAPSAESPLYTEPFLCDGGMVRAVAVLNNEKGAECVRRMSYIKSDWQVAAASSTAEGSSAAHAIDGDPSTDWTTADCDDTHLHTLTIDLGYSAHIHGIAYTPQTRDHEGMLQKGVIEWSSNGEKWTQAEIFEFGNLINDPTTRYHHLRQPVKARYMRISAVETAAASKRVSIAEIDVF